MKGSSGQMPAAVTLWAGYSHGRNSLYGADSQAIDTPEILYDFVKGDLEASVTGHIAPAHANPLFSICIHTIA